MTSGNEDWELWLRLQKAGWGQVEVPHPLFRYRKHGVSMSVETEARFEEGRRMVRDRHPDIYATASLADSKRRWYPSVTVIGPPDTPVPADAELIESPDRLGSTWGKYVVDLRGAHGATPDVVERLAAALEAAPSAALARTTGEPPLTCVRRWNLHDPGADPAGELVIDHPASGGSVLPLGAFPREGWTVPAEARSAGVPVRRQRPEESALLPDPGAW
jgi:hypothetical protein